MVIFMTEVLSDTLSRFNEILAHLKEKVVLRLRWSEGKTAFKIGVCDHSCFDVILIPGSRMFHFLLFNVRLIIK